MRGRVQHHEAWLWIGAGLIALGAVFLAISGGFAATRKSYSLWTSPEATVAYVLLALALACFFCALGGVSFPPWSHATVYNDPFPPVGITAPAPAPMPLTTLRHLERVGRPKLTGDQIARMQRDSIKGNEIRDLISEGRGHGNELISHREITGRANVGGTADIAAKWFAEMAPNQVSDQIRRWSDRVRPVITGSDELTGAEKGALVFFPEPNPLFKRHSVQALLGLIDNHVDLLKRLASRLGEST
jgi:hypothetical protein